MRGLASQLHVPLAIFPRNTNFKTGWPGVWILDRQPLITKRLELYPAPSPSRAPPSTGLSSSPWSLSTWVTSDKGQAPWRPFLICKAKMLLHGPRGPTAEFSLPGCHCPVTLGNRLDQAVPQLPHL